VEYHTVSLEPTPTPATVSPLPLPTRRVSPPSPVVEDGWVAGAVRSFTIFLTVVFNLDKDFVVIPIKVCQLFFVFSKLWEKTASTV
jgi:hypothetical protein